MRVRRGRGSRGRREARPAKQAPTLLRLLTFFRRGKATSPEQRTHTPRWETPRATSAVEKYESRFQKSTNATAKRGPQGRLGQSRVDKKKITQRRRQTARRLQVRFPGLALGLVLPTVQRYSRLSWTQVWVCERLLELLALPFEKSTQPLSNRRRISLSGFIVLICV